MSYDITSYGELRATYHALIDQGHYETMQSGEVTSLTLALIHAVAAMTAYLDDDMPQQRFHFQEAHRMSTAALEFSVPA